MESNGDRYSPAAIGPIGLLSTLSWAQPDRFHNMVIRLGGMRFLHELHFLRKITDDRKWSGR